MKRLALLVCLLLALGGGAYWFLERNPREMAAEAEIKPDHAKAAIPVRLAPVKRMLLPLSFMTIGTIQPIVSIPVTARVSGVVTKVDVADGAEVKQDDVLVELDTRLIDAQIQQAQAAIARDQANIDKAQRDLDRINKLVAEKVDPLARGPDAQTAIDLAKASLLSDQAALQSLEVQREYYSIRAPIAGRVGTVPVRPGSIIMTGERASPIVTINGFDPIYVSVGIPQKMIADLAEDKAQGAARISLTVPGRDDKLEGAVTAIDNAANAATGLVTVLASIANSPAVLWPGELVKVEVIFRDQPDVLVVPNVAIRTNQQGNYVYTVDASGRASLKPVVVARSAQGLSVVSSGLAEGDNVVTDGQLLLSNGALVSVKEAME